MKQIKIAAVMLLAACGLHVSAQIAGPNGYGIGNYVEFGIAGAGGYEGADTTLGVVPGIHYRSDFGNPYHGFVADPQMSGWLTHDGDFFTPGTPENGWGLEIGGSNGVNVNNNCVIAQSGGSQGAPGAVTGWQNNNGCIRVDWSGGYVGSGYDLSIDLVYEMKEDDTYYTTEVNITNNGAASIDSLFYYRNVDPDNNETLSFDYSTNNTIVSQPDATCNKALVSATQTAPWNSYMGFGAIGDAFRVSYGGFSNRDASNIWYGTGGLTGTTGSVMFSDIAISLAYLIEDLDPGETQTFKFLVILDGSQVEAAITSLYSFNISGGLLLEVSDCSEVDSILACWQPGSSFDINIEGPGLSFIDWTWSPGTGLSTTSGPNVTVSASTNQTYTIAGVPLLPCFTDTIFKVIELEITPAPILDIAVVDPNCGLNDGSVEAIVTSGTSPIIYDWWGGPATPTWTGLGTGSYSITITDAVGCSVDSTVTLVNPGAPVPSILSFQDAECGVPTGEVLIGATGGTTPYTFDIGSGPQSSGLFTGLPPGFYSVTITDDQGCASAIPFWISDTSTIAGVVVNLIDENCGTGDGEVEVVATGGASPFTYDIGSGPQVSGIFNGLTTGAYVVTVTDAGGCSYDVPLFIDEVPLTVDLGPDVVDCFTPTLSVTNPGPYLWSTAETTSSIVVSTSGTYWIQVGSGACTASDTVEVTIMTGGVPPYLPNVFTPNNDGDNDRFNFVMPPFIENYRLRIYDIWGILMYETTDKGNGWDGKNMGGSDVPDGTYFWTLEYVDPCVGPGVLTESGNVMLFR